jgi:hypothetical protein
MIRDADGRLAGVAAILRDVTEQWNRERALRERIRALEGAGPKASG